MKLFHGSPTTGLTEILPLAAGAAPTDGRDPALYAGLVFGCLDPAVARTYAGAAGTVYEIWVPGARPLREIALERAGKGKSRANAAKKARHVRADIFCGPYGRVEGTLE